MKKMMFLSMAFLAMMSFVSCDKEKKSEPTGPTDPTEVTEISGTLAFYVTASADKYCTVTIQQSTDGKTYTDIPLSNFTKRAFDGTKNAVDAEFFWAAPTLFKSCWTTCYQFNNAATLKKDQKTYYSIKLTRNSVPVADEKDMTLFMGAGLDFYNAKLGGLPAYTLEYFNTNDKSTQVYNTSGTYKWTTEGMNDAMTNLATKNPNFYLLFHGYTE